METESGRDGEIKARREMGGGAKEEWRETERQRQTDRQTDRQRQRERLKKTHNITSSDAPPLARKFIQPSESLPQLRTNHRSL